MGHGEQQYLDLLGDCLSNGVWREGRNGATYGLFGRQIRFDLREGFPLLTTKRLNWHAIVVELLWFLRGDTNVAFLREHGVHIWDKWADPCGELGPVYGKQWRSWPRRPFIHGYPQPEGNGQPAFTRYVVEHDPIDQITNLIGGLRRDPHGRRHIVTVWNPAEIDDMALPPCHCLFQFFVSEGRLSCQLYQRSADVFIGVPFNIASYALLTHLIAREVGLGVGEFVHTFGDVHLYEAHAPQAYLQLPRIPKPFPVVNILPGAGIFDLRPKDIALIDYDPHPSIKADVVA